LNAMNLQFWSDIHSAFQHVERDPEVRVVLLSGAGRVFTAGLDLTAMGGGLGGGGKADVARTAFAIRRLGKSWQDAFNAIETCGKPVIACVHNAVIGAGVEMLAACDIRFCSADAYFSAAEVNIGLAADVGGLQRLPKVLGNQSLVRELVMSARRMVAAEALQHGFVSRVLANKEDMMKSATELAVQIASKSPVAMTGIKELLNYSRDHSVEDSLNFAITWNMAMIQGVDMKLAAAGFMSKKTPEFQNVSTEPADERSKL